MRSVNLLKINLLPAEFLAAQKEAQKFRKIQFISVSVLVLLVFLASLTIGLRVLQTQRVNAAQISLDGSSAKVSAQKQKEAQLVILKDRLTSLRKLITNPSKQLETFNIVSILMPSQVVVNSISVDPNGNITLSLITADISALQSFIDKLMSKEINEGKISKIEISSIVRSREAVYKVDLKVISDK